jgi:hypothetical protein
MGRRLVLEMLSGLELGVCDRGVRYSRNFFAWDGWLASGRWGWCIDSEYPKFFPDCYTLATHLLYVHYGVRPLGSGSLSLDLLRVQPGLILSLLEVLVHSSLG